MTALNRIILLGATLFAANLDARQWVKVIPYRDKDEALSIYQEWHAAFHYSYLGTVKGVSMEPHLHTGDYLFCEPYVGQRLKGQVVIVSRVILVGGLPTIWRRVHAVQSETKDAIYLDGLNNRHSDGWVYKKDVLWVVVWVGRVG